MLSQLLCTCTLHQQPAPALDTISDKAVPWLGSQPHPTKMQLILQNCLYSRALPGLGKENHLLTLAELVRLQEAWNVDTAEIKAARNKVRRKIGLKPSLFWPFLFPSRTVVTKQWVGNPWPAMPLKHTSITFLDVPPAQQISWENCSVDEQEKQGRGWCWTSSYASQGTLVQPGASWLCFCSREDICLAM